MIRIIKDFVPKPVIQILCDRKCPNCVNMPVEPGMEDMEATHVAFIQGLQQSGWRLSIVEHVCPAHVQKERGEVSMIVMPGRMAMAN